MQPIETQRLIVRRFTLEDADFIVRLLNDPAFIRNIGDRGVRTADDAREYLRKGPLASYERHGFGLGLVVVRDSGAPAGTCGLIRRPVLEDVDIGYAFLPEHCGKGYATEAASAVLSFARATLGLRRVVAVVNPDNEPSIGVLRKLGFTYERMVRLDPAEPEIKLFAVSWVTREQTHRD